MLVASVESLLKLSLLLDLMFGPGLISVSPELLLQLFSLNQLLREFLLKLIFSSL